MNALSDNWNPGHEGETDANAGVTAPTTPHAVIIPPLPVENVLPRSSLEASMTSYQTPSSGNAGRWVGVALIAALIGGIVGAGTFAIADRKDKTTPKVTNTKAISVPVNSSDIKTVINKVEPAVVSVNTDSAGSGAVSAGTGMILRSDGEVLTNAHVVSGGTSFTVTLFGKTDQLPADLMGIDSSNDVALLKIRNQKDLPVISLGNSDQMQVGDPVIAIGNALALAGTPSVTTGIISATGRSIDTQQEKLSGLLQTDAAINFGNSGGPLVNAAGEVVGINTATADPSSSQNIGFAIAINNIKPLLTDLRAGKNTNSQALLGVTSVSVTPDLKARFSFITVDQGAIVDQVSSNSPASVIGLQQYDVIIEVAKTKITSNEDLINAVHSHKPGDKVEVVWLRNGKRMSATATLASRPVGQ